MQQFVAQLAEAFFLALGVVLGGSVSGYLGMALVEPHPSRSLAQIAARLKIWGMVTALGGTFATFQTLEAGILGGEVRPMIRQLLYLLASFSGAHLGYLLLRGVGGE
ncbi:MAG: YtrH family sporulation protein [Chloroflexi bacterium]|nr:YtrH family sporulation protein [Chloroflexota bacterium]MBC7340783.1 YtrH family sporulation protein [Bacillota bacterium]